MPTNNLLTEQKSRVFLIEDHPIVRQGLAQLLNAEPDLAVCGEAENAADAMRAIAADAPDVVVLDISLPDGNGLDLVAGIHRRHPKLPMLVLSMHKESLYAERALRAGARGYIMKEEATARVLEALRQVLAGGIYVSQAMAAHMIRKVVGGTGAKQRPELAALTDREFEVFRLIGQGMGPTQMAEKLGVSVKTIESYREHIKIKLNLPSGMELTRRALAHAMGEEMTGGAGEGA